MAKRKFTPRPYPTDESCPCGSKRPYRDCCARKRFRYEIDARGQIVKSVPIHKKLKPVLKDALAHFKEVYGRKPKPCDRVFFEQFLESEEDFWRSVIQAGRSANIREEILFAWRRTGLLVAADSIDLMSDFDLREWEGAVREFRRLRRRRVDPYHVFTYLNAVDYEVYKRCVSLLDYSIIITASCLSGVHDLQCEADFYRFQLALTGLRSLRTVRKMYENRYDDDCLSVARGIYEAYLRMKFIRLDDQGAKRFHAMTMVIAGVFKRKQHPNGRLDRRICVDASTGQEFDFQISNREIIKRSSFSLEQALYDDIYPYLSSFVHPDIFEEVVRLHREKTIKIDRDGDPVLAIILVLSVSLLLAIELEQSSFLTKTRKRDLSFHIRTCSNIVASLISSPSVLSQGRVPPALFRFYGFELSSGENGVAPEPSDAMERNTPHKSE